MQIPLDLGDVLDLPRMVFPFHIQTCETGARHPINTLTFWMETIGEAYEVAGWAFPTATYENTRSFTIHDQRWEIFQQDLFPPSFSNFYLLKSKMPNYILSNDWVKKVDSS